MNQYIPLMIRFVVTFLVSFLTLYALITNASETEDSDEPESIQLIDGQPVIFLDEDSQKASGLKTLKLRQIEFQPEFKAYGKAISIIPLLSIRNQHSLTSTKLISAKARYTQAKNNISRLRNLHKNEAISTRKLQKQQSQWLSDKAVYDEVVYQNQVIINNSQLQWGEKLTQWATTADSPQFQRLLDGQSVLLKITLAADSTLQAKSTDIFISPSGKREVATRASLISTLPQVDAFSQGSQYIFQSNSKNIKIGMNFTAWIPQFQQKKTGVIIPRSSLAWHLGEAFVFIKINNELFAHRTIINPIKTSDGFFITGQITNGEEIVIMGTQMLLSHEFRSQIPDEDDD